MRTAFPGFGDSETWGACTNHPNDPRTPELDDDAADVITTVEMVKELVDRAEKAVAGNDIDGACQALDEIRDLLEPRQ